MKEYKDAASLSKHNSFQRIRKEAVRKALVIQQLGDPTGIPFLLRVMLQQQPVSIALKFDGDGNESLTLNKAGKRGKVADEKD